MLFVELEAVLNHGAWSLELPGASSPGLAVEDVRAHGVAVRAGAVVLDGDPGSTWGRFVAELEWGRASGDADPTTGSTTASVSRRDTASAPCSSASPGLEDRALRDPRRRRQPGTDPAPRGSGTRHRRQRGRRHLSRTRLRAAANPRPRPRGGRGDRAVHRRRGGPRELFRDGRAVNFDGGDPRAHDLGLELDASVELRFPLSTGLCLQLGVEGAALFPGYAWPTPTAAATPRCGRHVPLRSPVLDGSSGPRSMSRWVAARAAIGALLLGGCTDRVPALTSAPPTRRRSAAAPRFVDGPAHAPFPSDLFTVPDPSSPTGLRLNVALPAPTSCSVPCWTS
jgi:hypothetical protein